VSQPRENLLNLDARKKQPRIGECNERGPGRAVGEGKRKAHHRGAITQLAGDGARRFSVSSGGAPVIMGPSFCGGVPSFVPGNREDPIGVKSSRKERRNDTFRADRSRRPVDEKPPNRG